MGQGSGRALQFPDFRRILQARGLLAFALQFQSVVIGWQVYQLKGEALYLGLIGLTEAIPAIIGALIAGHWIDNSRPARLLQGSLILLATNTFGIWCAVNPGFGFSASTRLALLFVGIFISGAGRSFASPSALALVPQILPREELSRAAALNSSVFTTAQITGPALGGLIFGWLGAPIAFAVPVGVALAACVSSLQLSPATLQLTGRKLTHPPEPILISILGGWRFLRQHHVLLATMALDMFSVLFGGTVAVLPIFADQVFHVGAHGLGFLRAAPAVGSLVVSVFLATRPFKVISGSVLLIAIAGFGLSIVGFAATQQFQLALFFLAFSGACDGINMIIRGTLTQLLTPDHMRGRVLSLSSVFITSSNEIGALESGLAATAMGLIPSVVFGGVMTLVIVLVVNVSVPELRRTRIQS